MATKKCPVCDVPVKLENLERHIRDQHPRANVDPAALLTEEERMQTSRAKQAAKGLAITRRGGRIIALVSVLVAVVLILVILNPFGNVGPGIGQAAPNFSVSTTTGSTITLSAYRGSVVLLEFMDLDCPTCEAEVPTLVSLHGDYGATVRFVSINVQIIGDAETDAEVTAWASSHGATWPYAIDFSGSIRRSYGVAGTPTTFVIDANGIVRAIVTPSALSYADFAAAIEAASGA